MTAEHGRTWPDAERARAIGLALARGANAAAAATGIPRRTISRWLASPGVVVMRQETRGQVAERLWSAVVEGTDAVLAGLRDPKARLGEKAAALRIVVESHALITGGATARTESTNLNVNVPARTPDETEELRAALAEIDRVGAMTDDELAAWLADGGAEMIRDANAPRRAVQP